MVAVLPAQLADLERIAAIHHAAFAPSAISRRIFADVKRQDQCAKTVARLTKRLDDPRSALFKAVVDNDIVGFALWERPRKPGEPDPEHDDAQKGPDRWPAGTNVALAESFFARLDLGINEPHYHLSLLATDPERQRSGAGSALLRWGSRKADEDGVECYLEATELAIPVYLRGQYELFREPIVAEEDAELVLYPMRRPALKLRPATLDDIPALAPAHRLAFWPTRVNLYSYSDVSPEAYESHFINRFSNFIKQRDEGGARYLLTVAQRGDMYLGYAFSIYEPDEKERPAGSGEKRFWPEGANVRRAEEYLAGTLDKHKKDNLPFAHWSLSILSVHPDSQGQGVGRKLVQEVLDHGKRDGVPVTLESTELGRPLYEKMGFVDFGEILRAKEDPEVELWPMRHDSAQK
ncbi:uncharacterized protein RHOBADRAFT_54420 [Rhodotorula graminis WP1]|uniref:N-acetyltransferase domain-containing protein n=1 Tax=Rhodotorula graminis (strain WP1) TaxID=578459 RepID=A0A0P9GKH2_RHOGW|nr:uncharacterized protein RHOBADRAFT_54420 [Rhodotorula graminis WP1]KPV73824.1 hypothetical protein RHOBADRAFT_54420 [Rhodotorula graminis WP1]